MNVTRDLALEVFGLKEDFSDNELKKRYRRLSKIAHPDMNGDANLFRFITECNEKLQNTTGKNKSSRADTSKKRESKQSNTKVKINVGVKTLYKILNNPDEYVKKYNVEHIIDYAKISIWPLFRKNKEKCTNVTLWQPMHRFLRDGHVYLCDRIEIPVSLKKYSWFRVKVEFLDETYSFNIYQRNASHVIVNEAFGFYTILDLRFHN